MKPAPRLLASLLLAGILGLVAGCGPSDPLDQKIKAADASEYNFWLNDDYGRLPPVVQHDYDEAFKHLSFATMAEFSSLSADEKREKTLAAIDGLTVRAAIINGLTAEVTRIQVERKEEVWLQHEHEKMLATPSTDAQIGALKMTIESIKGRIEMLDREISRQQQRIGQLAASAPKP